MKSSRQLVFLTMFAFLLALNTGKAQVNKTSSFGSVINHVFDADSLSGFDEQAASASALENACYGNEFKVFMYKSKRKFILEKYNISVVREKEIINFGTSPIQYGKAMMPSSGACNNDDFEDATSNPGPQLGGVVNGWTLFGGTNADYCFPFANGTTATYTVFNAPTIDPIMTVPNNTVSSYFDANSFSQPAGSCFIRLNNASAGAKVIRASKTYTVSSNNAVFRYAYRAVISDPSHSCCDQPGFHIKVTVTNTTTSQSTVVACPNVSVAAGTACGPASPGFVSGNPLNGSPSSYNANWVPGSLDLSSYIGFAVTLDVYAIDCALSGHAGYVYFDALCSPMTIVGNGQGFPAGSSSITIPTCGAAGGTITAPNGLGPYSWNSSQITIPAGYTVPSYTNQTLVTNQSGTIALTMNPPGSCAPINKVLTVTITPAPIALASATQASCTNPLSAATLTTAGSASINPTISWTPPPATVATNSMSATGLAVGITTIGVYDGTGCYTQATVNILPTPPQVTFAVNNLTGSYSLTCTNPTINMSATSSYSYGTITYTWSSISFTATGSNVALSQTGNYNVCGMDAATSCSTCQTFTINQNFTVPTNTVSPTLQIINCTNSTSATFSSTALSPTNNIATSWYSPATGFPGNPATVSNGTLSIYSVGGVVGTHTVQHCDLVNGCCNTKTVEVQSTSGFPTFQTSSTTNYSVGCSPNAMTLCITSVSSAINGPTNYLFLPPGTPSAIPVPTTAFSSNACTTTGVPGTWTLVVNDITNGCQTAMPVFIIQNTVAPHVDYTITPNTHTLTCFNPTLYAAGSSTTANSVVSWIIPSNPPALASPTLILGPPTGPATNSANLTYTNYFVVSTNTVNGCKTTQTVVVSQNFKKYTPIITLANPSKITCKDQPVQMTYSTSGGSGIPGAVPSSVPYGWYGPAPQTNAQSATYNAFISGTYSLVIQDTKNGCLGTGTVEVKPDNTPPVIVKPVSSATMDCASVSTQSAAMQIVLSGTVASWSILFTEYPTGSNFGPTAAIGTSLTTGPNGLLSSGVLMSQTLTTDKLGAIEYVLTNTDNGCQASGTINVTSGSLSANFSADATTGYAPLTVNFTNSSASSANSNSITSVWNFGNGTSQTTTTNINTNAVYTAPGTYTIVMYASKGTCADTAYQVIKVDIPSKLEIPNVFTPNGDGSNDLFFLKTQNLTEITTVIFDRWGNKIHEVTSTTGNIGWDGKNQEGKECPPGTYFYIIKATGKDGTAYDQKGNVSLYR